jgi:hypothetical protein
VNGSLHTRHLLWIGLAATLGIVLGFVIVTNLGPEDDPGTPVSNGLSASPVVEQGDGSGGGASDKAVVPDLVGQRLPAAEALLAERGFRQYNEMDISPEHRLIVDKNNWIVDSQSPAAGTATPVETVIVIWVKKPTDITTPSQAAHGVIPSVVCAELQDAQDALRHSGFYLITSKDGTGQGRLPVMDRNWVVTEQSEKPGSTPGLTTLIVLTVVKHGEDTGLSGCPS